MPKGLKLEEGERLRFKAGYLVRLVKNLNRDIWKSRPDLRQTVKFASTDLIETFNRYRGNCAFCGVPLTPVASNTQAHFAFYVPIRNGGSPTVDNLIPICRGCSDDHKPTQRPLMRIPEVNGIPHLIQELVVGVRDLEKAREAEDGEKLSEADRRIRYIKEEINVALEELAVLQRYSPSVTIREKTKKPLLPYAGQNTVADIIESMADVVVKEEEVTELPEQVEQLEEHIEQIKEFKRYKVVRI